MNDSTRHPYGAGSHAPLADSNEMPKCYPIKGNGNSMKYHRPDSSSYAETGAEVWFDSPSAAEAAGFSLSGSHPKTANPLDFEPGGPNHPCTAAEVASARAAAHGLAPVGGGVSTQHPYGAGSHALLADKADMPMCYPIKGTVDSQLYHRPDSMNYGTTIPEVWFDSPSAAEAAGFALAGSHPKDAQTSDFEPGGSQHPCAVAAVNANRSAVVGGTPQGAAGEVTIEGDSKGAGLGTAAAAGAAGVAGVAGAAGLAGKLGDADITPRSRCPPST